MGQEIYEVIDEKIINFASEFTEKYDGLDLIKKIYLYIKNEIYFDCLSENKTACDTLVFGSGNNKGKNLLLFTVLRHIGFKCFIIENRVKNNSKIRFNKNTNEFQWYTIKVEFLEREIILDPTFDKLYLNSTSIRDISRFGEDQVSSYSLRNENVKLFQVSSSMLIKEEDTYIKVKFSYVF